MSWAMSTIAIPVAARPAFAGSCVGRSRDAWEFRVDSADDTG
jgi:hypothetical protein